MIHYIDEFAKKDHRTKDKEYNNGLRKIREYGYIAVCAEPEVKYYKMCNGL